MAVITVANVEKEAGLTQTSPVSASKAATPASPLVVVPSMALVIIAIIGMWYAYRYVIRPPSIGFAKNYVPYAGVIAATAALERFLEPLSHILMQGTVTQDPETAGAQQGGTQAGEAEGTASPRPEPAKMKNSLMQSIMKPRSAEKKNLVQAAAASKSKAQAAAADPSQKAEVVQPLVKKAAEDQASADTLRTNRTIFFWAIASICGVGISGGFGLFLLQSIATSHVNSFLDLAVTGLTIGAGTKPTHDLITSLQAKSSGSS